ncbi:MAG TPA: HAD hydrolase-like protein [Candidatus Sumerlaeota bacterium]|nr:HAD hydrolase-like protein [Candidatus Sumerlaeota bacterium]
MNLHGIGQIIWDWNGTLINDTWICVEIVNRLLKRIGKPILTIEDYRGIFDFPVIDSYRALGFDFDKISYEEICDDYVLEYYSRLSEYSLHDGAMELLDYFAARRIPQVILSATERGRLERAVSHFGITHYFEALVGCDDHAAGGKKEQALIYMSRHRVNPRSALVIGDTTHDCEVSATMGTRCLLVPNGHQSREKVLSCGCPSASSLREVMNLFEVDAAPLRSP